MDILDIESVVSEFIQEVGDTRSLVIFRDSDYDFRDDKPTKLLIHTLFGSGLDPDMNTIQNLIEKRELIQVALALGFI